MKLKRKYAATLGVALVAAAAAILPMASASAAVACAPAWSASAVYVGGNTASQNSHNYSAKWWTQNESPATHSGQWDVWADQGACGGSTPPPTTPPTTSPTTPPTTTPTTVPPSTGPLPAHFLTGYWQNFDNPANEIKLAAVPSNYDLIAVAFADATGTPGAVSFSIDA